MHERSIIGNVHEVKDTFFILIFNRQHYIVSRKIFCLVCLFDAIAAHSYTYFTFLIVCIVIVYFNVLNFDDIHHFVLGGSINEKENQSSERKEFLN